MSAAAHASPAARRRAAAVLGAVLTLLAGGCGGRPAPAEPAAVVRYRAAGPAGPLAGRARYVGILRGDPETALSFRVSGILERIGPADAGEDWREGMRVGRGVGLARLKQEDFQSALSTELANRTLAESNLERTRRLRADGTVSPQELDVAQARRDAADAAWRRAQEALVDSVIAAPYDGVILARLASAGETILAGRTVLRVADLRRLALEVGVPDTRIGLVTNGMAVEVSVSAFEGERFGGEVTEVGVAAKEGSRLFRVMVRLPNPEGRLKPGMSATVDLGRSGPGASGAVAVPLLALVGRAGRDGGTGLAVFVLEPEGDVYRARERAVETGDLVRTSVVVTRGLEAGEKVVTVGAATLVDGALVTATAEQPDGMEGL